jgi:putative ABC transport system substrate-binding protein
MPKKLVFVFTVLYAVVTLYAAEARAEKKVGLLIWSEENRYTDAKNGVLEQLKKNGFGEPRVKFIVENAGGNKAKAAESARKFAAAKMDMVIAIGTSAAIAAAKEIQDVPLIFSMVYDPVDSKIAADWKSSGNNTTGASPKVPMSQLVSILKQFAPVKRLAVLYTPGEKNSESQLKELLAQQAGSGLKIVPVPLTRKEEVATVLPDVVGAADAIYLSGSNIVGNAVTTIVDIATKAKVITVTHLDDLVEQGVMLGVCADAHLVGALAGTKAAKVLKGAKPSSIPIETVGKWDVIVNKKTAKAAGIEVPPAFIKQMTRTIE